MSYLMIYMGTVSGSPGGRDDGYPEEKRRTISNDVQLVEAMKENPKAKFYELKPLTEIDTFGIKRKVKEQKDMEKERRRVEREAKKEAKDKAEYARLQEKFGGK